MALENFNHQVNHFLPKQPKRTPTVLCLPLSSGLLSQLLQQGQRQLPFGPRLACSDHLGMSKTGRVCLLQTPRTEPPSPIKHVCVCHCRELLPPNRCPFGSLPQTGHTTIHGLHRAAMLKVATVACRALRAALLLAHEPLLHHAPTPPHHLT